MAAYYIDPVGGSANAAGTSAAQPRLTHRDLNIQPGDTVLFKRGSLIRGALGNVQGTEGNPVTYGAYGEGENPAFSGSVDVSREENWEAVPGSPNVWRCLGPLTTQVCNFVFNNAFGGALKWEREALSARGDWWDSAFGQYEVRPEEHTVLLYCEENPAKAFQHIECVLVVHRNLAVMGHDIVLENLTFKNNGVHGFSGTNGKNVIARNCRFEFIGGCVWSKELRIRFGNGVEFWNSAENAVIEHCVFYDIFDSGVTHQGEHGKCLPAKNLVFRNNLFVRCGMAAYEQRDVLPLDAQFVGNVCADAGRGFSHYGTELPRSSEIWPQPMGHHIFLWRIDGPTENARFALRENVFMDAPYGAAIYSIIDRAAEAQTDVDSNTYCMRERTLLNRYFGEDFNDFAAYVRATGKDAHSLCADISAQ